MCLHSPSDRDAVQKMKQGRRLRKAGAETDSGGEGPPHMRRKEMWRRDQLGQQACSCVFEEPCGPQPREQGGRRTRSE